MNSASSMFNVWGLERSQISTHFCPRLTHGLERSQLLSLLLSTASCTIGWGLEMTLLGVLSTADSYPIDLKGLERSLKFCG